MCKLLSPSQNHQNPAEDSFSVWLRDIHGDKCSIKINDHDKRGMLVHISHETFFPLSCGLGCKDRTTFSKLCAVLYYSA